MTCTFNSFEKEIQLSKWILKKNSDKKLIITYPSLLLGILKNMGCKTENSTYYLILLFAIMHSFINEEMEILCPISSQAQNIFYSISYLFFSLCTNLLLNTGKVWNCAHNYGNLYGSKLLPQILLSRFTRISCG